MDADRLFHSAAEVVTLADGPPSGARRGADLRRMGAIAGGAIAVKDGFVVDVGTTPELRARVRAREEIDLSGMTVVPGFVDAHTHPVFVATREGEFHRRL